MKFYDVIYSLSLYKNRNDIVVNMKEILEAIQIPKEEIIRFKFKNRDIINNNKENNISKIKLFENKLLDAYVIFFFDKNNVSHENNSIYSKIIYDIVDPNDTYFSKDFIATIDFFLKE